MNNVAIISADLVHSSQLNAQELSAILSIIKEELKAHEGMVEQFSIYRGDSFQAVVGNPADALLIALTLKSVLNAHRVATNDSKSGEVLVDVRISIGIGEVTLVDNNLEESNGQAFHLSGRTLDAMKSEGRRMALTTVNADVNSEFKVHFTFLDSLTNRWSLASAEVVYYLLKKHIETEIAQKLNRSQAAINQRKKAAGWEEIKTLLNRYREVAEKHFV